MLEILQNIVTEKLRLGTRMPVIRNYLKEYLQYPILFFIYSSPEYRDFVFTGGSCLRICFDAPRLSEDLDFDVPKEQWKTLDLKKIAGQLAELFRDKYLMPVEFRTQSDYRIYLKFPILKQLGLADRMESDLLFLKIEPNLFRYDLNAVEKTPISKYGFNFIARNYKQEYLMVGKINAIFSRIWFKGKNNEIDIKGRDFYDLYWHLQKKIEPNWERLKENTGIANKEDLKKKLFKIIAEKTTMQKLAFDLKDFFPDQNFVDAFCENYKEIIGKYL